jgi:magnesium-transporting ATPase (P-type)
MCAVQNKRRWFFKGFLFVIVFISVLSLATMLLWNWLMPMIFGITSITYLQAMGLLILSKILLTGIGKRPSPYSYGRRKYWHEKFEKHFNDEENKGAETV